MKPLDPVSAAVLEACASEARVATDAELAIAQTLVARGYVSTHEVVLRGRSWRDHGITPAGERALRVHRAWIAAGRP